MIPSILVLTGYGINCDYETEYAFKMLGAFVKRVHVNDVIDKREKLEDYQILVLPGGFSYGDDIASGRVFANKLKYNIGREIEQFIKDKKLILGICNGFQSVVKYGLLPGTNNYHTQTCTVTFNDSGRFEDRWVYLKINKTKCIFTKGMTRIYVPVRHGEGKFVPANKKILKTLMKNKQIVAQYSDENFKPTMKYPLNPNGSVNAIAGICDKTGRIFGMMPHPEAFLFFENHPRWTRIKNYYKKKNLQLPKEGQGVQIFRNAVNYVKEKF